MLTAIALGTVFYRPGVRVAVYAAVGTVFTVIAQAALNVALTPFAIPALTAPFVLVSWLFLLPGLKLERGRRDACLDPCARLPALDAVRDGRRSSAAVATLATRSRSVAHTVAQGIAWGTGHTSTLMLCGGAVLVLGIVVPAQAAQVLELAVV